MDEAALLVSKACLEELAGLLSRPTLDPYIGLEDRQEFFRVLNRVIQWVPITYPIKACRDPKRDKFLEVAVNGKAGAIVTRDKDLLALRQFRNVEIITPAAYLNLQK